MEGKTCRSVAENSYTEPLAVEVAYTHQECGEICQNFENCTFWTLYEEKNCYLLDQCSLLDDQMAISGEKDCPTGNYN